MRSNQLITEKMNTLEKFLRKEKLILGFKSALSIHKDKPFDKFICDHEFDAGAIAVAFPSDMYYFWGSIDKKWREYLRHINQ